MARKVQIVLLGTPPALVPAPAPVPVPAPAPAPAPVPGFTPCRQCGYPADCARAAKCSKGFK